MKKLILHIIILCGICIQASAQSKSRNEIQGDKFVFNSSFSKAIVAYNNADKLTVDGKRKLAMSLHKMAMDTQAENAYADLINSTTNALPEDLYNYAMVLKINGKYEKSVTIMNKFASSNPKDLRALDFIENKNEYNHWIIDNGVFKIQPLQVNTNAEDFGPSYFKDKIVFASSRADGKMFPKEDNWHNQPYLDLYVADVKDGQLSAPTSFSAILNSKLNDGPASFNKEGTFIAFTRNNANDKSKDRVVELQIFFSRFSNGNWTEPEKFIYNNPAYSVGHPSLTADGNTMYFASNMPGGFGKTDIYKTTKDINGTWSKPENMGNTINTESDELFPFFEENSMMLFFASDGRYGLGGLDIFIAEIRGNNVGKAVNVGTPINTAFDDFSAIANDKMTKGYFSSNRSSGKGSDDIFSFDVFRALNKKKIQGITKQKSGLFISYTMVTLLDGSDKTIDSVLSDVNGSFMFRVEADKKYTLLGKNSNFLDGSTPVNSLGVDTIIKADIILLKKPIAEQIKEKAADLAKILELNEIYFDLNKSNIRSDAKVELDKIVRIMNEYPDLKVELRSYTDCRASVDYNQILSDQRAQSTAKYIKSRITKPSRIFGKGYGETKHSADCPCEDNAITNCSEEEYQQARRSEFIIVQ